jgi:NAD(P)-dependent dehydrogenase (short-subunit alcohol dehydrogenase family)
MRLDGKTALITGGNSGIGLAAARLFLAEGARVAITGRNRETLDAAAKELGPGLLALKADVTDEASMEAALAEMQDRFGPIDVLVANAGIGAQTPLGQSTREAFDAVIATNLTGVFFTVQAALPHLADGASVILLGSVHAKLGMPGWGAYAASKGAIRSLGRVLASELAPRRIRVNLVSPGGTRTPIWGTAELLAKTEARIARSTPLARMSEAEEVARAALFLASDDAANVTAAEIMVDGGATGAPAGAPVYTGRAA